MKKYFILFLLLLPSTLISQIIHDNTSHLSSNWISLGLQNQRISKIAIDWTDSDIIYAGSYADYSAGKVGSILKTTNRGKTWDTLLTGISVSDIDINPRDHNMVFVCCGVNLLTVQGILKTTDAGLNWVWADSGMTITWEVGPILLEFSPNFDSIIYVSVHGAFPGNLYKTTNYGMSWQGIGTGTYLLDGVKTIAINPHNDNEIFCGTLNGFHLRSSDQGNTWFTTNLSNAYSSMVYNVFSKYQINKIYASGWGYSNAGLQYSTDHGLNWIGIGENLPYRGGGTRNIKFVKRGSKTEIFLLDSGLVFTGYDFDSLKLVPGIGQFHPVYELEIDTIFNRLYIVANGIYYSDLITGITEEEVQVENTSDQESVIAIYPNPLNNSTTVKYKVYENSKVSISLYDLQGRFITKIIDDYFSRGVHEISFNEYTRDLNLSSGVYFLVYQNGKVFKSTKCLILK